MPWILWGKPFNFCLVQQFKQPMFQKRSVEKTSRRTRRTTLQPPATVWYQKPAILSALWLHVWFWWHPEALVITKGQVAPPSSLPFAIQTSAELQKRASWLSGKLRGWQEPRAANSIRQGRCCRSNPLLPPSTLSTKQLFTLVVVLTSLWL